MNSLLPDPTASLLERIKISMVGLKMPRAIEVVDTCVSRLDRGEITALELVEQLLLKELTFREVRRIRTSLRMGRLNTVKTLTGYDFSFQPSLDKARILALAELCRALRNRPPSGAALHRQEPPCQRSRPGSRQSRQERLDHHPCGLDRCAGQGRTGELAAREDPLLLQAIFAERRRDRLPPGHTWWRQSVLPAGQCAL